MPRLVGPAISEGRLRSMTQPSLEEAEEWIDAWQDRWQAETNASWVLVDDDGRVRGQIALRGINLGMGASCRTGLHVHGRLAGDR